MADVLYPDGKKPIYVGSRPQFKAEFTVSGIRTDPTVVTFKIEDPSGNETAYVYGVNVELVKESTGVYYVYYAIDEAGEWIVRFNGTGACYDAVEATFAVPVTVF